MKSLPVLLLKFMNAVMALSLHTLSTQHLLLWFVTEMPELRQPFLKLDLADDLML